MGRFRDIVLPPDSVIKVFRYRRVSDSKYLKYTLVDMNAERLFCRGTAETQLISLLGLSIRSLEAMEPEERDEILSESLKSRLATGSENIILRVAGSNIWSVVTEIHALIKHSDVWKVAEDVLGDLKIGYTVRAPVRTTVGLSRKYLFDSRFYTDGITAGMLITNSVKGLGSLTVAKYMEIVICQNGLISPEVSDIYSMVHRGDPDKIIAGFKDYLKDFISKLSLEDKAIADAKTDIIADFEPLLSKLKIAEKYRAIVRREFESPLKEVTRYDLVSSISRAAKFAPPLTTFNMEQLAYRILRKEI